MSPLCGTASSLRLWSSLESLCLTNLEAARTELWLLRLRPLHLLLELKQLLQRWAHQRTVASELHPWLLVVDRLVVEPELVVESVRGYEVLQESLVGFDDVFLFLVLKQWLWFVCCYDATTISFGGNYIIPADNNQSNDFFVLSGAWRRGSVWESIDYNYDLNDNIQKQWRCFC